MLVHSRLRGLDISGFLSDCLSRALIQRRQRGSLQRGLQHRAALLNRLLQFPGTLPGIAGLPLLHTRLDLNIPQSLLSPGGPLRKPLAMLMLRLKDSHQLRIRGQRSHNLLAAYRAHIPHLQSGAQLLRCITDTLIQCLQHLQGLTLLFLASVHFPPGYSLLRLKFPNHLLTIAILISSLLQVI